jgi:bacteriorhodopsin
MNTNNIYNNELPISQEEKNKKPAIVNNVQKNSGIKASFTITYILLLTTSLITFIEAIRTQSPIVRHIFNLETCISLVAGYFYSIFVGKINYYEHKNIPIDWKEITQLRYIDWSITTPMMLLSLCIVLALESKTTIHLMTILVIIVLNYAMLYIGYLGETNILTRNVACIGGFIPFVMLFYIIYKNYVVTNKGFSKYFLFIIYIVVWSLYGIVYLLNETNKNIALNILDCIAKCIVGILLWVYYTNIIPKF